MRIYRHSERLILTEGIPVDPLRKCLVEVGDEVVFAFESDRDSQHSRSDPNPGRFFKAHVMEKIRGRVNRQCLHSAQTGRARCQPQPAETAIRSLESSIQLKAEHSPAARHLPLRQIVLRMTLES